jgi:hypothetical protein
MTDPRALPPHEAGVDTTAHLGRIGAPAEEQNPRIPLTAEEAAAVAALPRHSALLVVQYGSGAIGERFLLDSDRSVAGRSEHAEVFLDDVTVSRDHAVLVRRSGAWFLDDSGSLNGTYVNRRRIESHRLEDGDELQIGKYKLTYLAR